MTEKLPLTTAERIARAKEELANGVPEYAMASALIAIAELMATNMTNVILDATTRGAVAATEALATVLSVVNPYGAADSLSGDICGTCHAHHDKHSNDDLSCPAYTSPDGSIVFSTTHRYADRNKR